MEHFDETGDPLTEYFIEKIQAVSVDRKAMTASNKGDSRPVSGNGVSKELQSVEQVKHTRAMQFVLQTKVEEFTEKEVEDKKVEKVAEDFEQQFSSNQVIIDKGLEKQRDAVMLKLANRRCQSFSRTLRDV